LSVLAVRAAVATHQQRANKALHPTAYSLRYASFLGFAPASGGG
jgi:hypothetical protein